jgi:polyisoprenyl-phosphate glycosyltransferase
MDIHVVKNNMSDAVNNLLSIVVPIFNEEANIENLYNALCDIAEKLQHFNDFEIIMVNDGSRDRSLEKLRELAQKDIRVKVVSLTRNFGHEAATSTGINFAKGAAVFMLDADLQDPPEMLLEFEKEYVKGFDIVVGQRVGRRGETVVKKIVSKFFYYVFKKVTGVDMPDVGDFCLLRRKVVDVFKSFPERKRFVRGLIYWPGFSKKTIKFVRQGRAGGFSNYNYFSRIIFALDSIICFSILPMYWMIFLSMFLMTGCVLGIVTVFALYFLGKLITTIGWLLLIITMLSVASGIIFFLGIIGVYIGIMFQEVKQRPISLVDETINL